ncbi:MAG: ABC transporter ATP-binding protein [Anaerocolumna sp.]
MAENYMIELHNVTKKFGGMTAVNGIDLRVKQGEFLTFLGPSGCGKTTTLRMIAGFEEPSGGHIIIDGKACEKIPPNLRDVNTVFQNYALFPHLSIRDNIAFGLKLKKRPKAEINEKVSRMIRLVKLEEHMNKKPSQLSGGQKQRVAIARSLVNEPKVLLLDEPLGALDLKLRKEMQLELKHLQRELGITFVYVTHDQEEALTISDRIVIMNNGNIEQLGNAEEIYERPRTKFAADFIGETNLLKGKVIESNDKFNKVDVNGIVIISEAGRNYVKGSEVYLSIRPENIHFADTIENLENYNIMEVIYEEPVYVGNLLRHLLHTDQGEGIRITRFTRNNEHYGRDTRVKICWSKTRCILVHDESGVTG